MISVKQLCKAHGDRKILVGVDATVKAGETIAIVGPSGGGKSTLLRCLNYLESFDSGTVEICGHTLVPRMKSSDPVLRSMRQVVGMVFQQFNLFPHLSVLENITLAPTVVGVVDSSAGSTQRTGAKSLSKLERAKAEQVALDLLAKVGLGERGAAYPHQLSGGQQQRVAIARALAKQPQVMLFDEPTSALDPEMRDEVMKVMRELAAGGMTMLVVTHEMQFATDVASRIWVIDRGTIVEDGEPQQVVANPTSQVAREFFARLRG